MSLISILTIGQPRSNSGWDSNAASLRVFNLANMNWPSLVSTEIDGYPRSVFEYTQNGVPQLFQSAYPVSTIRTMAGGTVVGVQSTDPEVRVSNSLQTNFDLPTNGSRINGYRVAGYIDNVIVDDCVWEVFVSVPLQGCSVTLSPSSPFPERGPFMSFSSGPITGLFSWIVKCTTPLGGISERPFNMTVIPS
jgi:hypothetical protein